MHKESFQSSQISSSHNRSKTLQKLSKICHTQITERKDAFDPYTYFIYRDNITRNRYEMSNLKKKVKSSRLRTKNDKQSEMQKICKTEESEKFHYYSQQLNFLKNIRYHRNIHLMSEFMRLRDEKTDGGGQEKVGLLENKQNERIENRANISKIKKKIQNQVMFLNQEFLREYLYHEQPFNNKLLQINRYSDSKVLDQSKINKLKKNILECIEEKKSRENINKMRIYKKDRQVEGPKKGEKKKWQNWVDSYNDRKTAKEEIKNSVDVQFNRAWESMKEQITHKVRFQGQFNWFKRKTQNKSHKQALKNSLKMKN